MKTFVLAMLALGTAVLALVVHETDLGEVWSRLQQLGVLGMGAVLLVYALGFAGFAASWLFGLAWLPVRPEWWYRLWKVLMVGSALEATTPLAGLGGEPVKAIILKRHYGIPYTDVTASLVLARTTDLIGQILFIAIGLALMFRSDLVPVPYRTAAGVTFAVFAVCIGLFLAVQQKRVLTRIQAWLEGGWLSGRPLGQRVAEGLAALGDIDDRLVGFYTVHRARFAGSVTAAFAQWLCEACATWIAVNLLGHPIGFGEALVIESFVTLIRSTFFFVPADIGTQDGAFVLICGALTGSPELGLAVAAVRRARDLLWIAWGLAIGSTYSLGSALREAAADSAEG